MNGKITNFFTAKNFTLHDNFGYGVLNGFETNFVFRMMDKTSPLLMFFSCHLNNDQRNSVHQQLSGLRMRYCNFEFTQCGMYLALNDYTLSALMKRLDDVLQTVCNSLKQNGALGVGYCPVCGKELDFENCKKCNIDGFTVSIDNDCVREINAAIEKDNNEFDQLPNNYLKGFLGALVGGLVGAIVAVLLDMVGFIAALSAFVAYALGAKLFVVFGGKPTKVMILIVSLTTVVSMLGTEFVLYLWAASQVVAEAGLNMGAFEAFARCMGVEDFARSFYINIGLTVLFTVIGCGSEIYKSTQAIKRQKQI